MDSASWDQAEGPSEISLKWYNVGSKAFYQGHQIQITYIFRKVKQEGHLIQYSEEKMMPYDFLCTPRIRQEQEWTNKSSSDK